MSKPASELIALADALDAWGSLVSSGYEVPGAGQVMTEAAQALRAANQSGSERARVDALREALDCLQSIADMEDDEPHQPDDADWRFRALECKRAAQCTIAALAREEIGAAEEIQSSDGGVEGHAAVPLEIPTQRSGESRDPLGDGSVKVGPHREDAAGIKPGPSEAHGKPDGAVRGTGHLNFFNSNVDNWGAAEWFDRMSKAIREQDRAVLAGDDAAIDICRNVAASSAMRLVRDYEQQVRSALHSPKIAVAETGPGDVLAMKEALPATKGYILRAMAKNYAIGNSWDYLDAKTCTLAADEIKALRAAIAALIAGGR